MISINIEIKKPNGFKDFLHKFHSRLEDMIFSLIQKLPEKFIPHFLMNWLENYTNKRLKALKQEIIRKRWQSAELEKVVDNIRQQNSDH